jgi:type VI protein secretion system component VasK
VVLASDFGTGQVFWSMLWFFLWIIWIWMLIMIFGDIFRSSDMSGWVKALWIIFVVILPYLGVLIYIIVRGQKMQQNAVDSAQQRDAAFRQYVQDATQSTSGTAEELSRLADLRDRGILSEDEFQTAKAKALG